MNYALPVYSILLLVFYMQSLNVHAQDSLYQHKNSGSSSRKSSSETARTVSRGFCEFQIGSTRIGLPAGADDFEEVAKNGWRWGTTGQFGYGLCLGEHWTISLAAEVNTIVVLDQDGGGTWSPLGGSYKNYRFYLCTKYNAMGLALNSSYEFGRGRFKWGPGFSLGALRNSERGQSLVIQHTQHVSVYYANNQVNYDPGPFEYDTTYQRLEYYTKVGDTHVGTFIICRYYLAPGFAFGVTGGINWWLQSESAAPYGRISLLWKFPKRRHS